MGTSPFFYIEIFNHNENKWEKYDVLSKNKNGEYKPVDLWSWNGSHDLFSVMDLEKSYNFPEFTAIRHGFPTDASIDMKNEYNEFKDVFEDEENMWLPSVRWFNLADALLYLKDNPMVENYDAMESIWVTAQDIDWKDIPTEYMDNPLKHLTDRVMVFLELADEFRYWEWTPSDVRIIAWKC